MYVEVLQEIAEEIDNLLVNVTLESGVAYLGAIILMENDQTLLIETMDERPVIIDKTKVESIDICLKGDFEETEKDAEIMHQ